MICSVHDRKADICKLNAHKENFFLIKVSDFIYSTKKHESTLFGLFYYLNLVPT